MPSFIMDEQMGVRQRENLLINGGFEIWQRGLSFTAVTTTWKYTCDRWKIYKDDYNSPPGGVQVVAREGTTKMTNSKYSMKVDWQTGGVSTSLGVAQEIENIEGLRGKMITFSVWVYNTTHNSLDIWIQDGNNSVSGAHQRTGWEKLTVSKLIQTNATFVRCMIYVNTNPAGGTAFYIDNAMCVLGDLPADFAPADPAKELVRCQRYYEKSYDLATVPGTIEGTTKGWWFFATDTASAMGFGAFAVRKRINNASITLYSPTTGASGKARNGSGTDIAVAMVDLSEAGVGRITGAYTAGWQLNCHFTADAEMY